MVISVVHMIIPALKRWEGEETAAWECPSASPACVAVLQATVGPCLEQKVEGRVSRMAQWVDICHTDLMARVGS